MTRGARSPIDEDLMDSLPLPLAQLARRADHAKNALERHQSAYYLWEAAVQVLASAVFLHEEADKLGSPDLPDELRGLRRPTLGQWWALVRDLLPPIAGADVPEGPVRHAGEILFGEAREDLPKTSALNSILREILQERGGTEGPVALVEVFDRMVRYRNQELGHGAPGQRESSFYERTGRAILEATSEILGRVDVLLGGRLVHVGGVRRQTSGRRLAERLALVGPLARREESLDVGEAGGALPHPGRLYLELPGAADSEKSPVLRSMHPLAFFAPDSGEFFFLKALRGARRGLYLCYTSGRTVHRDVLHGDPHSLVASVLGLPGHVEADSLKDASGDDGDDGGNGGDDAPEPEGKRKIGGFEILSRLGQGGMAVVYRAWQPSLGRQVALKCVVGPADRRIGARFAREIRALGSVEHENLVKIYSSGSEGDQWYYAMELVEGADLDRVIERLAGKAPSDVGLTEWRSAINSVSDEALRREQLVGSRTDPSPTQPAPSAPPPSPPRFARPAPRSAASRRSSPSHVAQAVRIVREAAEAAHALHEAGVIHRDIKPANIRLSRSGQHAVLMDLGLAQLADDADGLLTRTRQFVGTLRYSSPEQVRAAATLDRRADVYSLGATLWELLALRPIFEDGKHTPTIELMERIQSEAPGPASRWNLRVPADLDAIVGKCLRKTPANRYATARDLALDLARWERGEPVEARPPTIPYIVGKYVRRHRVRFAAAGAVAILALLGAAFAFLRVEGARSRAVEARREAQSAIFDLCTTLGLQSGDEANQGRAFLWFANAGGLVNDDLQRQFANLVRLRCWRRHAPPPVRAFPVEGVRVESLQFDRSGAYLLALGTWGGRQRRSVVLDVAAGEEISAPSLPPNARAGAWRPDGKELALVVAERTVAIHDIPSGAEVARIEPVPSVTTLVFSPDGRFLALGGEGGVQLWDRRTGTFAATWPHPRSVLSVQFDPAGRHVLTASREGHARVFAVPDGSHRPEPLFPPVLHKPAKDFKPVFVDRGRSFVTAINPKIVARWDVETGERIGEASFADGVGDIACGPKGRLVIVLPRDFGQDAGIRFWDPSMSRPLDTAIRHRGSVIDAAFRFDGTCAFVTGSDGAVRIWRTPESDGFNQPPAGSEADGHLVATVAHPGGAAGVVPSPDDRLFATFGQDLVVVWSLEHMEPLDRRYPVRYWERVCPSPDGRLAVFPARCDRLGGVEGSKVLEGQAVQVLELARGTPAGPVLATGGVALDAAFSPDGRRVATLSSRAARVADRQKGGFRSQETPGVIRLWDWVEGREVVPPVETTSEPLDAAFRPGSRGPSRGLLVVACSAGEIVLVDPATGAARIERQGKAKGRLVGAGDFVRFAPGGRRFATWGLSGDVRLWDGEGRPTSALRRETSRVHDARFSDDGRFLAAASGDGLVTVWELASAERAAPPIPHDSRVVSMQFSHDGRYLLTGERGGTVRVWDWRKGRPAFHPLLHESELLAASFCPDERWIVTSNAATGEAGTGGALRFWELRTGQPGTPPMSGTGTQIFFPCAGRFAAVGCGTGFLYLIDLRDFNATEIWNVSPGDLRLLGEVLSGERINGTRTLVNLSAREWFARWKRLRETHPELVAFDASKNHALRWHERMAKNCGMREEWAATEWHLAALAALGRRVERKIRSVRAYVRSWRFSLRTRPWPDARTFPALDAASRSSIEEGALSSELVTSYSPRIDFRRRFPEQADKAAAYAAREIYSDRARKIRLLVGSDDEVRIWLDGDLVHENLVKRGAVADQDAAEAQLRAGPNPLLVEVGNSTGQWALYLRIEDEAGKGLWLTDNGRLEPLEVDAPPSGSRLQPH